MDQEHSTISPSGLYRVFACPGSVQESQFAPVQQPSIYAQRGTLQHEAVEPMYNGLDISHLKLSDVEINSVEDAVDYLKETIGDRPHKLSFEVRGDLSHIGLPNIWGTADIVLVFTDGERDEIHVIDWKFGHGTPVLVDDNPQQLAYLTMVVTDQEEHYSGMFIHIVQPPKNYYGIQQVSPEDLWAFSNLLKASVQATELPNSPIVAGKHCQFCPAKSTCKPRYQGKLNEAAEVFDSISMHKVVTPDQRAAILIKLEPLVAYYKELQAHGYEELHAGRKFPGFKLVRGRSTRKWRDEDIAKRWLIKYAHISELELYEKKFLSPPKVEKKVKALKKDPTFQKLIDKPPGSLTMVPLEDKRDAFDVNSETEKQARIERAKEVF